MPLDLIAVSDAELVREIYRRIKGDSEMHYHRNYVFREALRPICLFFDKQGGLPPYFTVYILGYTLSYGDLRVNHAHLQER